MNSYYIILTSAVFIAFVHTILGPDHYVPFVVLSKSMKWSLRKTLLITIICGIGHVLSSVLLGILGIIFGEMLLRLVDIESKRGELAALLLLIFGFTYFVWGLWRAIKNKEHKHIHTHNNITHSHIHGHEENHLHLHEHRGRLTAWILFLIFVFGPCEPLIPLIIYPAAQLNLYFTVAVALIFCIVTLLTMTCVVFILYKGLSLLNVSLFTRYIHAIAGFIIFVCGFLIKFLDL